MSEVTIGFLYKAASLLPARNDNKTLEKLKSYYMMRCKDISKGYGLPQKQFSEQIRCTHCCLEWNNGSEIKVQGITLSKRQRKRMKSQKTILKINLLNSNELVQRCSFCRHITKTVIPKPNKSKESITLQPVKEVKQKESKHKIKEKVDFKKKQSGDVYSNSVQVFSLNNKKNILKSTIKEPAVIKNNKKRKDKFAGLCQRAVLASAKLKDGNKLEQNRQSKLSLFLKPST